MNYYTTRRFPRSLSEAFSDTRAHCIEVPEKMKWWEVLVIWGSVAFTLAVLLYKFL